MPAGLLSQEAEGGHGRCAVTRTSFLGHAARQSDNHNVLAAFHDCKMPARGRALVSKGGHGRAITLRIPMNDKYSPNHQRLDELEETLPLQA